MGTCLYTSLGGGGGGLPGPSSFQKRAGGLLRDREAPETGRWVIMIQSVSHQEGRLDPGRGPAGFALLHREAAPGLFTAWLMLRKVSRYVVSADGWLLPAGESGVDQSPFLPWFT